MTTLQGAQGYHKCGFVVVPVRPRTKKPFEEDWPQQRLKVADLPEHFNNGITSD
jgi:hypothetical protein